MPRFRMVAVKRQELVQSAEGLPVTHSLFDQVLAVPAVPAPVVLSNASVGLPTAMLPVMELPLDVPATKIPAKEVFELKLLLVSWLFPELITEMPEKLEPR